MNRVLPFAVLFAMVGCGRAMTEDRAGASPTSAATRNLNVESTAEVAVVARPSDQGTADRSTFVDEKIGITFPSRLGDLSFAEHISYPQSNLGYSIRYQGPGAMRMDIYVYEKGLQSIPAGHNNAVITSELANAEAGIRYYQDLGAYLDVERLGESVYPEHQDEKGVAFVMCRYRFRQLLRPGVTFDGLCISETYVSVFKSHFIKIRVTYPEDSTDLSISVRDKSLQQLITLLTAAS